MNQPKGPFPMIKRDMLNESIRDIRVPDNMLRLPVSRKGFPVPHFVAWVEDEWDFRIIRPEVMLNCIKFRKCWLCGQPLGGRFAFVTGPMCVITKTSAEPPSHQSCAEYAAIACPFLANPRMRRNDKDMPEGHKSPAGIMIDRNPGVTAVLIANEYRPFNDGNDGILIQMGEPLDVQWYAQRRKANQKEVLEAIESGLPLLTDQCDKEATHEARQEAHQELAKHLAATLIWLPRLQPGEPDPILASLRHKRQKAGDEGSENTDPT